MRRNIIIQRSRLIRKKPYDMKKTDNTEEFYIYDRTLQHEESFQFIGTLREKSSVQYEGTLQ